MLIMVATFFEICALNEMLCMLYTGRDSASAQLDDSFLRAVHHVHDDRSTSEHRPLTRHSRKIFELQQLKVTSSLSLHFAFLVIFSTVLSAYRSRWAQDIRIYVHCPFICILRFLFHFLPRDATQSEVMPQYVICLRPSVCP